MPTTSPVPRVGVFRHVAPEPPGPTTRGLTRAGGSLVPGHSRVVRGATRRHPGGSAWPAPGPHH